MAGGLYVQASFLEPEGEVDDRPSDRTDHISPRAPEPPPSSWRGGVRSAAPRRPLSHVRVTRDPAVALAWDDSHRLSAEATWTLARTISDERLEELRALVGRSRGASVGSAAVARGA